MSVSSIQPEQTDPKQTLADKLSLHQAVSTLIGEAFDVWEKNSAGLSPKKQERCRLAARDCAVVILQNQDYLTRQGATRGDLLEAARLGADYMKSMAHPLCKTGIGGHSDSIDGEISVLSPPPRHELAQDETGSLFPASMRSAICKINKRVCAAYMMATEDSKDLRHVGLLMASQLLSPAFLGLNLLGEGARAAEPYVQSAAHSSHLDPAFQKACAIRSYLPVPDFDQSAAMTGTVVRVAQLPMKGISWAQNKWVKSAEDLLDAAGATSKNINQAVTKILSMGSTP